LRRILGERRGSGIIINKKGGSQQTSGVSYQGHRVPFPSIWQRKGRDRKTNGVTKKVLAEISRGMGECKRLAKIIGVKGGNLPRWLSLGRYWKTFPGGGKGRVSGGKRAVTEKESSW